MKRLEVMKRRVYLALPILDGEKDSYISKQK